MCVPLPTIGEERELRKEKGRHGTPASPSICCEVAKRVGGSLDPFPLFISFRDMSITIPVGNAASYTLFSKGRLSLILRGPPNSGHGASGSVVGSCDMQPRAR